MDDQTAQSLISKNIWVRRGIYILFACLIPLIGFVYQKIKDSEYGPSIERFGHKTLEENISFLSRCDGSHSIEGRVILPRGYKKDISKMKITAIKKGSVIGSDEKCQHDLELDGIYFDQNMEGCISNQELKLSLDSDEYEIAPGTYLVCQTGVDVKLKSKVSL